MKQAKNIKHCFKGVISWLLAFIMLISTIPAFGAVSMQSSGAAGFTGPLAGSSWSNNAQFLRITLLWAPYAEPGDSAVDFDGITWAQDKVKLVGDTFDWALGDGTSPGHQVDQHSEWANAYEYGKNGHSKVIGTGKQKYAVYGRAWHFEPGSLKNDAGGDLQFPCRAGGKNDIDTNVFFQQRATLNEVCFMAKESPAGKLETGYGAGVMGVERLKSGMYMDSFGDEYAGKYLIIVEPGIYMPIEGVYTAFTMRDALAWGYGGPTSKAPSTVAAAANALQLQDKGDYVDIGLKYAPPRTFTNIGNDMAGQFGAIRESYGVGLVWFNEGGQLPVINYYYTLTEEDIEGTGLVLSDDGSCLETESGEALSKRDAMELFKTLLDRAADDGKRVEVAGNKYDAPPQDTIPSGTYDLICGYVQNKKLTAGNLDIQPDLPGANGNLPYFGSANEAKITQEAKDWTKDPDLTEEKITMWSNSQELTGTVKDNNEARGVASNDKKGIYPNGEGGITVEYNQDRGNLQGIFLYVNGLSLPPISDEPVPDLDIDFVSMPTNVTKMYYENEEDESPINTVHESIGKNESYTIEDDDPYEVVEWILVTDLTPGEPEHYHDWDEVIPNEVDGHTPSSGTEKTTIPPTSWSDPDAELFIKLLKKPEPPKPVIDADLYLSEKRITWLKSLYDFGEHPKFTFRWPAITGVEYHRVGRNRYRRCKESILDGGLFFVTSNKAAVKSDIMGNVTYFKPYDMHNTKGLSRGNGAGETTVSPNYGFVIWRGKDIPTIAQYKYDGSTLNNTITDKKAHDIIKNIVPREGKQPAGDRHPENGHEGKTGYYMDKMTIVMGSIGQDTGLNGTNITGEPNVEDRVYTTKWSYCGKVSSYSVSNPQPQTYNVDVRVDVGYGKPNTGNTDVTFSSENLNAFDTDFANIKGFPVNNTSPIKMYPYVEMFFDTTHGLRDQSVMTLAGHESKIVPKDYIEIGYKTAAIDNENKTGLLLQSKQWSVHQAATKLGTKNTVLPGGAIYRLTTPGGSTSNTRTLVAMSSWLTFLPADTIEATIEGKDKYNGTAQNERNEKLYQQLLNSLNNLDIVQIVNNEQVLQEKAGQQVVTNTSGQPTSPDLKYWLTQNLLDGAGKVDQPASVDDAIKVNSPKTNEADLDIISTKEERIYYRVYSDIEGNVYVSKSLDNAAGTEPGKGEILGKISKAQSESELLAQNDEIRALNNRTRIVTNFLKGIDRNLGEERSLADKKWYNEAWDGICVVRVNKLIEIGFKDNGAATAARTSAIDPKLCPPIKNQSDLFSKKSTSWFESDKHTNISDEEGYVGTYKGADDNEVKIYLDKMNGLYKSKTFFIPNATVMSLY